MEQAAAGIPPSQSTGENPTPTSPQPEDVEIPGQLGQELKKSRKRKAVKEADLDIGALPTEPKAKDSQSASALPKEDVPRETIEQPPEKKTFKFKSKVNGVEEDVELTEDEMRMHYQLSRSSDRRFKESTEKERRNEAFVNKMKTPEGVIEVLEAMGYDVDDLAEQRVAAKLGFNMLTPEQKRIYELEQAIARERATREQTEAQTQKAAQEQALQAQIQELNKSVIEGLEKVGLPKDPKIVWMIARQMRIAAERDIDISVDQAIRLVEKELEEEGKYYGKLPPERLVKMLGDEALNAVRKYDLSRVQNPVTFPKRENNQPAFEKPEKGFVTDKEFEKRLKAVSKS